MTKKMVLEALLNKFDLFANDVFEDEHGVSLARSIIEKEIAQLEKRASAPKKPSKSQQENVTHKAHLLAALAAADAPMGIADLREAVEGDLTPNKVSALMGQLVTEGKAARIPGKGKDRKVTFTLA